MYTLTLMSTISQASVAICDGVSIIGEKMSNLKLRCRIKAKTSSKEENLHPQRHREHVKTRAKRLGFCDSFLVSNILWELSCHIYLPLELLKREE